MRDPRLNKMILRSTAALILCLLIIASTRPAHVQAVNGSWTKVVSPNFVLVSDAGEDEARKVVAMLERFRHTVLLILPQSTIKSAVPTKVFHFRTHGSFRAFKPKYKGKVMGAVNGYFFGDGDQSFIALTTDAGGGQAYEVIFHEYQHFLLSNILRTRPSGSTKGWLNTIPRLNRGTKVARFCWDGAQPVTYWRCAKLLSCR